MSIERRVVPMAVALALLTGCGDTAVELPSADVVPAFAVGGSGPMVSGSGHRVDDRQGGTGFRNFSFTAHSGGGQYEVTNRTFDVRLHGTVECVSVVGNRAWFAGTVTQSNFPNIPVGVVRAFYVVDNGEGEGSPPDQIANSLTVGSAQAWCSALPPRPLFDIEQGNIQVGDASTVTAFTDIVTFPVTIGVFIPCAADGAGEVVFLSGDLHSLVHTTVNGNRVTFRSANHPQGISGTGLTTGDTYQATGITQEVSTGSLVDGQFSDTFINNFRIIGEGADNNYLVRQSFHVTVNANGELTVFVDNFSVDCR